MALFTTVKQKLLETAWDRHCKAEERGHAEFDGLRCIGASGAGRITEEPPGTEESTIKISRSATVTVAFIDMAKVKTSLGTSGIIWQIWQIANDGHGLQLLTQHHTVIITHPAARESWR